jgi:hypothetical protein
MCRWCMRYKKAMSFYEALEKVYSTDRKGCDKSVSSGIKGSSKGCWPDKQEIKEERLH